jgi:hypothetical protein
MALFFLKDETCSRLKFFILFQKKIHFLRIALKFITRKIRTSFHVFTLVSDFNKTSKLFLLTLLLKYFILTCESTFLLTTHIKALEEMLQFNLKEHFQIVFIDEQKY